MQLIVFAGLPGTGKSTLAEAVARTLHIPVFAKDWLEAALRRANLVPHPDTPDRTLGYAGYDLLTTLAECQLRLGQSVILDSVASIASIRDQWRTLATTYNAEWRVVECVCSDESLHRTRLESRQRNIPDWHELPWAEVERVRAYYVEWNEPHLVVDMVAPLEENMERVVGYLRAKTQAR